MVKTDEKEIIKSELEDQLELTPTLRSEPSDETVGKSKGKDTMESLIKDLGDNILPFAEGENVEATILAVGGNRIWVDVAGQSLGFIPEKEITSKTGLKNGDKVFCTVVSMEDDAGNVVLSMKRADREKYWIEFAQKFESGDSVIVKIVDANKGGLMTEVGGIQGFLPVSQLSPAKYPRVTGGDKEEILTRLRKFIGQEVPVKVISCDKENNKLIFSEKAVKADEVQAKIEKYKVGDKVVGKVTGIVDFGLFVSIDPQIEGLVHISEVSWSRVSDLNRVFKVGDEVSTIIISVDDGRVSLSIKRLLADPWVSAASNYHVGQVVSGEVTKITPFGAFVALSPQIDGLVHISELSKDHIIDPGQIVELGKEYQFKIISIEAESHRLGLSLKVDEEQVVSKTVVSKSAEQETGTKGKQETKAKMDSETSEPLKEKAPKAEASEKVAESKVKKATKVKKSTKKEAEAK